MKKTFVAYFSGSRVAERAAKETLKTAETEERLKKSCPKANWKQARPVNGGAGAWTKAALGA